MYIHFYALFTKALKMQRFKIQAYPLLFFLSIAIYGHGQSHAQTADEASWITTQEILGMTTGDGKAFIHGFFTAIGPYTGAGVVLDKNTFDWDESYPKISGYISSVVGDGAGGWYVGGGFTKVGDVEVRHIVHIKSDKSVNEDWTPAISNHGVNTLYLDGNILYVGGSFTSIDGIERNRIAAFDISTGELTSWNPNVNGQIYTITSSGTTVYIGGSFTMVGDQSRSNLAAVDATSGIPDSWNPGISGTNSSVRTLAIDGNLIYVGGNYTIAAGQFRRSVSSIDLVTGLANAWNPSTNPSAIFPGLVLALIVDGSTVYAAGGFNNIGGIDVNGVAALNNSTGAALPGFNANLSFSFINDLYIDGDNLYLLGSLQLAGDYKNFLIVDKNTGEPESGQPEPSNNSSTMAIQGDELFLGGGFISLYKPEYMRDGLGAIEPTTGIPTAWNPPLSVAADYNSISLKFNDPYVYYYYPSDNTVGRLDTDIGDTDPSFLLNLNGQLSSWAFTNDVAYLAGWFNTINGEDKERFAAVDLSNGTLTSWAPNFQEEYFDISAMQVHEDKLFLGGEIESFQGQARNNLMVLDITTGNLLPWNPVVDDRVKLIEVLPPYIYISGDFTSVNGLPRNRIARFLLHSLELDTWNPAIIGTSGYYGITSIIKRGNSLFVGGDISEVNGITRLGLAEFNEDTGTLTDWALDLAELSDGGVLTFLGLVNDKLIVAGGFSGTDGNEKPNLAIYNLTPFVPYINIFQQPPTTINTCENEQIQLSLNAIGADNLTYQWQKFNDTTDEFEDIADGTYIIGTNSNTLAITASNSALAGTYRCKVTGDGATDRYSINSVLNINSYPNPPIADYTSRCGNGSLTLLASGASNGQYRWYSSSTDNNPLGTDAEFQTEELTETTSYFVSVRIGACESERIEIIAAINEKPEAPISSNEQSCIPASLKLQASGSSNGNYRWYSSNTDNNILGVDAEYITSFLSTTTSYFVSIVNDNCESERTEVIAEIITVTAPTANDAFRCGEGPVTLSASGSGNNYRWYASETSTDVLGTASEYTILSISESAVYYVSMIDGNCESERVPVNVTVEIVHQPGIDINGDTEICEGESTTLIAPDGYTSYVWSTGATQQSINISQAGNYAVTVTSANGCESPSSNTVNITTVNCTPNAAPVIQSAPVTTFIGSRVVINLLDIISDEDGNLDLSTLRIINNQTQQGVATQIDNQYNLIVDYSGRGFTGTDILTIEVCDLLNACTQQQLTINVIGDVVVYNAMSPNGDGLNDTFIIQYIDLIEEIRENKVTIYNRWGDVVFEVENYDNVNRVFTGLNKNGNVLPAGNYFYKIEFKSGLNAKTGFISLKR